jgi:hypothetical protein
MGKTVMIIALAAILIRVVDNYFNYGMYTAAVVSMAREILRSFGL